MGLLDGPSERIRIRNVALMMFCENPDKFFPYMQVEIVKFPDGSIKNPDYFIESPPIKGSVPTIIKRTMEKLQDMVIVDKVTKLAGQMESVRRFSYPYAALEEAVVNTFYHRDYMSYEPVQIEIEPECINIISFPGIDRSVSMEEIKRGDRFRTRMYRNRRLGEFLKELHLSEGRSTGVPTIQEKLEGNGSSRAIFETDEDRRATRVEIPIHPDFLTNIIENKENSAQKNERSLIRVLSEVLDTKTIKRLAEIIRYLDENDGITPQTAKKLINKSDATVRRYLKELVDVGILIQSGNTNNIIYEKNEFRN